MREHFTDLCQFELIFDFYVYDFVRYLMVWNFRCLSSSLCKIMYVSRRPECNFKVEQTQNFFFRQSLFGGFFGVLHHHEKQTFGKRLEIFSVLVAANWNKLHQRRLTSDWRSSNETKISRHTWKSDAFFTSSPVRFALAEMPPTDVKFSRNWDKLEFR